MSTMDDRGSDQAPVPKILSQRQIAEYVCAMAAQLARLAREGRLETLAYILEMARDEAAATRRTLPRPGWPEERG